MGLQVFIKKFGSIPQAAKVIKKQKSDISRLPEKF